MNEAKDEIEFLRVVYQNFESLLIHDANAGVQSCYEIIKENGETYTDKLFTIVFIIGIIDSETNERYKWNYISLFLASTPRERTYWLMCYAFSYGESTKSALIKTPQLLHPPENISNLLIKYNKTT